MQSLLITPPLAHFLQSEEGSTVAADVFAAVRHADGAWVSFPDMRSPVPIAGRLLAARFRAGVIDAQLAYPNASVITDGDRSALTFKGIVPEIVVAAARGRALGDVVEGAPDHMRCCKIVDVKALPIGRTIVIVRAQCQQHTL